MLQPALRTLTHDYNALKRQVRDFPGMLYEAMQEARNEVRGVGHQIKGVVGSLT